MVVVDLPRDLRRARRSRGHTQIDAAAALGVAPSTIARWETGTIPTARRIPGLAEYLGVTAAFLAEHLHEDSIPR